ncbi:MAG TPA: hypothetical protein VJX67_09655 [Blastocatellia bacterium]|nr:hypothetical protein [Blastocatellia bacterium]
MRLNSLRTLALTSFALLVVLAATSSDRAQNIKTPYPSMAPVDQYLMNRDAEIALARSAGPESITKDAEVLVLGHHGYETAVKGKNGFVCIVERGWTAGIDDPSFWNPKLRGPLCLNPAAARSYLPLTIRKTELVLAGRSKAQMVEEIKGALDKKELPALEPGAMCYMLSKQGYLNDQAGHWHPHLMFFVPLTEPDAWGADAPGSPVLSTKDPEDRLTVFMIPVAKWSDGTADAHEH